MEFFSDIAPGVRRPLYFCNHVSFSSYLCFNEKMSQTDLELFMGEILSELNTDDIQMAGKFCLT